MIHLLWSASDYFFLMWGQYCKSKTLEITLCLKWPKLKASCHLSSLTRQLSISVQDQTYVRDCQYCCRSKHWAHGLPLPMAKVSYWKKLQTSYYSQVWSCRRASTENWYSLLIFVQFSKSLPWKTASHSQNEDSKMCAGQFGGWDLFFWPLSFSVMKFFLCWQMRINVENGQDSLCMW